MFSIVYLVSPPGVTTFTVSPFFLPIRAPPSGLWLEILPREISASSWPTKTYSQIFPSVSFLFLRRTRAGRLFPSFFYNHRPFYYVFKLFNPFFRKVHRFQCFFVFGVFRQIAEAFGVLSICRLSLFFCRSLKTPALFLIFPNLPGLNILNYSYKKNYITIMALPPFLNSFFFELFNQIFGFFGNLFGSSDYNFYHQIASASGSGQTMSLRNASASRHQNFSRVYAGRHF